MDLDPITALAGAHLQRLTSRLADVSQSSVIAQFVESAQDIGPYDDYKVFPARARSLVPAAMLADGTPASQVFLKAVLMRALLDTCASGRLDTLPARVRSQQLRQMLRMAQDEADGADWLAIDHDLFHKEFGIATLRLYVAGAQLVDFRCGIPRSTVLKGGATGLARNVAAIARLGGFRSFFQVHTHTYMLDTFHEAGWNECYLCCAELYALHPDVLGMFGSSWFYDPALEQISPKLAYLRTTPQAGGAELFFIEEGGSARGNSLATSPTRRKLFEEGKYSPKNYMVAWGRTRQIAWAKAFLAAEAGQSRAVRTG